MLRYAGQVVVIFDAPRQLQITPKRYKRGKEVALKPEVFNENPLLAILGGHDVVKELLREHARETTSPHSNNSSTTLDGSAAHKTQPAEVDNVPLEDLTVTGRNHVPSKPSRGQRPRHKPFSDIFPILIDSFTDFTPSRQRFLDQLTARGDRYEDVQYGVHRVKNIICNTILGDHRQIMADYSKIIDVIDEDMSNDRVLRSCIQHWRTLLGQWKRNFSNDLDFIACIMQSLEGDGQPSIKTIDPLQEKDNSTSAPPLRSDFEQLAKDVKNLMERSGSTFQTLMATMGIVESQKAIAQAESISKLTTLAFFFIPLTLCSTVLGMNIKVSPLTPHSAH